MNKRKETRRSYMLAILMILSVFMVLGGCSGQQGDGSSIQTKTYPSVGTEETEQNYDTHCLGIVKAIEEEQKTITIYDIEKGTSFTLNYTGGTDVRNQYGDITVVSQIALGEIVDAYYYSASFKLTALAESSAAWRYSGVKRFSTVKEPDVMTIADSKYKYDGSLMIFNGEEQIQLMNLSSRDELFVRGIGKQIYSITVTKGHGYIRLTNYSDFIGGTIEIGYGMIVPIVKNMLIVAREGSYKVYLENGELNATKNITVSRDEEITLDLSDYYVEKDRIGSVRFDIEPYGADLYINGTKTDYSDPVKLNYGKHSIQVSMTGYEDFKGILTIAEPAPTIDISLADGTAQVADEEDADGKDSQSTPSPDTGEDGSTSVEKTEEDAKNTASPDAGENTEEETAGTIYTDSEHSITITAPEGAEVYMNGKSIGTVPVTVDKAIGTHVIILSQAGYMTKSYTIIVEDDGEDVTLAFPDMIQEE